MKSLKFVSKFLDELYWMTKGIEVTFFGHNSPDCIHAFSPEQSKQNWKQPSLSQHREIEHFPFLQSGVNSQIELHRDWALT